MTALVRLQAIQFPSHVERTPSPWPGRAPSVLHLTNPIHLSSEGPKGGARHAETRGFGLAKPEKKRRREEDEGEKTVGGNDDDDAIPQVVFDRMMRRVVISVATPMMAGLGLLYVLSVLKEYRMWDVPPWLPFATTLVFFGTSALGIAYGTLSTSWDPEREGTLLGWEEVQQNWPEIWEDEGEDKKR